MKEWLSFGLFVVVGIGMLISGLVFMGKEKADLESVKIYRTVSVIGAVLVVASILFRFVL